MYYLKVRVFLKIILKGGLTKLTSQLFQNPTSLKKKKTKYNNRKMT